MINVVVFALGLKVLSIPWRPFHLGVAHGGDLLKAEFSVYLTSESYMLS